MNNLVKLETTDVVMDLLIRQMINPSNGDFFVKNLTLGRIQKHLDFMNDKDYDKLFFKAFEIAKKVVEEQKYEQGACPECGCQTYTEGCACPNCDYLD